MLADVVPLLGPLPWRCGMIGWFCFVALFSFLVGVCMGSWATEQRLKP